MLAVLRVCTSEKMLACGKVGLGCGSVQLAGSCTEAPDLIPSSTKIIF